MTSPSDQVPMFTAHHDGETYDPHLDKLRLNRQQEAVYMAMRDGRWRTLREIADITGEPEASISARLRDLRKPKFGGFTVDRRRRDEAHRGIYEYQLTSEGRSE